MFIHHGHFNDTNSHKGQISKDYRKIMFLKRTRKKNLHIVGIFGATAKITLVHFILPYFRLEKNTSPNYPLEAVSALLIIISHNPLKQIKDSNYIKL